MSLYRARRSSLTLGKLRNWLWFALLSFFAHFFPLSFLSVGDSTKNALSHMQKGGLKIYEKIWHVTKKREKERKEGRKRHWGRCQRLWGHYKKELDSELPLIFLLSRKKGRSFICEEMLLQTFESSSHHGTAQDMIMRYLSSRLFS